MVADIFILFLVSGENHSVIQICFRLAFAFVISIISFSRYNVDDMFWVLSLFIILVDKI